MSIPLIFQNWIIYFENTDLFIIIHHISHPEYRKAAVQIPLTVLVYDI